MKALALVALYISGLNPHQKVQIVDAHRHPVAIHKMLTDKPGRKICAPTSSTQPLFTDAQGTVQFCVNPVVTHTEFVKYVR